MAVPCAIRSVTTVGCDAPGSTIFNMAHVVGWEVRLAIPIQEQTSLPKLVVARTLAIVPDVSACARLPGRTGPGQ